MEVGLGLWWWLGSTAEKSADQKTSSSLSSSAGAEELVVEAVALSGEAQGKEPRKRWVEEGFL